MGIPPDRGILGTVAAFLKRLAICPQKMSFFKKSRAKRPPDRRAAPFSPCRKTAGKGQRMAFLHIFGGRGNKFFTSCLVFICLCRLNML